MFQGLGFRVLGFRALIAAQEHTKQRFHASSAVSAIGGQGSYLWLARNAGLDPCSSYNINSKNMVASMFLPLL